MLTLKIKKNGYVEIVFIQEELEVITSVFSSYMKIKASDGYAASIPEIRDRIREILKYIEANSK